jgi:FXSXX-COOH protein
VDTATTQADNVVDLLDDIQHTPLDEISADGAAEVVRRVATHDPDGASVDVAAFGSSI